MVKKEKKRKQSYTADVGLCSLSRYVFAQTSHGLLSSFSAASKLHSRLRFLCPSRLGRFESQGTTKL